TAGDEQDSTTTPEAVSAAAPKSKAEGARSALFRINPDGTNDVLWRANDSMGYSISPAADGSRILVGTNNRGRIYEVASDHSRSLLVQSPEDQISTLVSANGSVYATSSKLGRLYRIGNQTVAEGTYVSPVRDAKFAGQWGVITWRCSGSVELQTRTGN